MSERTVNDVIAEMSPDTKEALIDTIEAVVYSTTPKKSTIIFLNERINLLPEEQRNVFYACVGYADNHKKEECE